MNVTLARGEDASCRMMCLGVEFSKPPVIIAVVVILVGDLVGQRRARLCSVSVCLSV